MSDIDRDIDPGTMQHSDRPEHQWTNLKRILNENLQKNERKHRILKEEYKKK